VDIEGVAVTILLGRPASVVVACFARRNVHAETVQWKLPDSGREIESDGVGESASVRSADTSRCGLYG
jgi:hypothetical protein